MIMPVPLTKLFLTGIEVTVGFGNLISPSTKLPEQIYIPEGGKALILRKISFHPLLKRGLSYYYAPFRETSQRSALRRMGDKVRSSLIPQDEVCSINYTCAHLHFVFEVFLLVCLRFVTD